MGDLEGSGSIEPWERLLFNSVQMPPGSEERLRNDVGGHGGWGSPPHVGQHSVVIRLKHDGEALGIVQHVSPVTAVYDTEGAPITGNSTAAEQFLV